MSPSARDIFERATRSAFVRPWALEVAIHLQRRITPHGVVYDSEGKHWPEAAIIGIEIEGPQSSRPLPGAAEMSASQPEERVGPRRCLRSQKSGRALRRGLSQKLGLVDDRNPQPIRRRACAMKCMVVQKADQPVVTEDRPVPEPGRGEVRIRVAACGVCHSDHFVTAGLWPGLELPRVPGHEVAGHVDAVGEDVPWLKQGMAVGVGWHGGHDGTCDVCLTGRFIHCQNAEITGIHRDGGYAEYVVVPAVAVARVPEGMELAAAAPLLCAGVTTFNALRSSGARPGDLVAVQGLGGLGHLGVQYARAMGFRVVALSRGGDKQSLAEELGAHDYVDAKVSDPAEALQKMGGAKLILATAPSAKAISGVVPGLSIEGCLMIVGAPLDPIEISALDLISRDARVQGWSSGTAIDSAAAMAFADDQGVKAWIEKLPLSEANTALERMLSGEARFRVVLEM